MNQKQLANVLIKILGLSLCVHGLPNLIVSLIYGAGLSNSGHGNVSAILTQLTMGLAPIALAIFFIVRSRWLTDTLFKDEND